MLLFHGERLRGGFLGVDLFFVLSGFLITGILLDELGSTGRIALGHFWTRRARRLLPALGVVLVGISGYCIVFADASGLAAIRSDALATLGYVANWHQIARGSDYFAQFAAPTPLAHTWSLAIEEQFYVIWPLVLIAVAAVLGRRSARAVGVTALVLAAGSIALMTVLHDPAAPGRAYFGTDTRVFAILFGAALACGADRVRAVRGTSAHVLDASGLVALAGMAVLAAIASGGADWMYPLGFVLAALAGTVAIAAAIVPGTVTARALAVGPLCALGLISYGLYLWHWPVDVVLDADRTGLHGWALFALRTAVAIAIAAASARWVERPVRRGIPRTRRFWALVPVGIVAVAGLVALATAGATTTLDPDREEVRRAGTAEVLVVGDSVGGSLAPGLLRAGFDVRDASEPGCRLVGGQARALYQGTCDWRARWDDAVGSARPRVVVLVDGVFDLADVRLPGTPGWSRPGDRAWNRAFDGALDDAARILTRDGARVVIPTIPCLVPRADAGNQLVALIQSTPARIDQANAAFRRLAGRDPRVTTVELGRRICPHGRERPDGRTIRPDGVHFSPPGSDLAATTLAPAVRRARAHG